MKQDPGRTTISQIIAKKVRHLYSVDCGRASRGLFTGIFVMVITILSLILFNILMSDSDDESLIFGLKPNELGVYSANITEIIIYT